MSAATYDDLIKLPDFLVAEIVDGELFATPFQGTRHGYALDGLLPQLDEDAGWWFLRRVEVHLGNDVLVPDIAGWRHDRMPDIPDADFIELAPDWVCDVVAPKNATLVRFRKMQCYAAHDIQHAWIVDPYAKTIEVYMRHETGWDRVTMLRGNGVVRAAPLAGNDIKLGRLWID
jgi:Uma2 family endonuclease